MTPILLSNVEGVTSVSCVHGRCEPEIDRSEPIYRSRREHSLRNTTEVWLVSEYMKIDQTSIIQGLSAVYDVDDLIIRILTATVPNYSLAYTVKECELMNLCTIAR